MNAPRMHPGWVRPLARQPAKRGHGPYGRQEEPVRLVVDDDGFATKFEHLTGHQRNVLRLRCQGLGNKGAAVALGVSAQTVKNHVTAIFTKLGVNDSDSLCYRLGRHDAAWELAMRERRAAA